jgi:hypothetical protein
MVSEWVISNFEDQDLYWDTECGWVSCFGTTFTDEAKDLFKQLPKDGIWERIDIYD